KDVSQHVERAGGPPDRYDVVAPHDGLLLDSSRPSRCEDGRAPVRLHTHNQPRTTSACGYLLHTIGDGILTCNFRTLAADTACTRGHNCPDEQRRVCEER